MPHTRLDVTRVAPFAINAILFMCFPFAVKRPWYSIDPVLWRYSEGKSSTTATLQDPIVIIRSTLKLLLYQLLVCWCAWGNV